LIFQSVDSLVVLVEAMKQGKSTDPAKMIAALKVGKFDGARGQMKFDSTPGIGFQQWLDIPYVNYQLTDVNQIVGKTSLIQGPGMPLNITKLQRPK
jgi:ABC-type branched-subunit amino acid transport system substrate-binding protein